MREAVWNGGQPQPWCNDIILTPHVTQNPPKNQEVWVWLCKAATVCPWTAYQCAQTLCLCIHLIWMREAVWGGCHSQSGRTDNILTQQVWAKWCGACPGGSKSNAVKIILRLFLYHFLHAMSSLRHESIYNNTSNQQTPPPWWWSRSPFQRCGFDDTTPPEGRAALRMFVPRLLSNDFVWFIKWM